MGLESENHALVEEQKTLTNFKVLYLNNLASVYYNENNSFVTYVQKVFLFTPSRAFQTRRAQINGFHCVFPGASLLLVLKNGH